MPQYLDLITSYVGYESGLKVTNPANDSVIATVRNWRVDEVEAAVMDCQKALKGWQAHTAKDRAKTLRRWHDLIMSNQELLAHLITAECGKPLAEARGEVAYGASFVEWFAEEGKRIYGDMIPTFAEGKQVMVMKQAIGVVAAITPWNFPLAMITRKLAPALAAGCTGIVKPAESTPLTALALEKLAVDAGIPKDVLRVVTTTDPAAIGKVLTTHPSIRKFSFTGSTAVGKLLMQQCAGTVKKVSMELGGNAPFIVFDDADLDDAVTGAMISKYRNAGQTCVCTNRFFVHENVYDAFIEKFSASVRNLQVGDGAKDGTTFGPLINRDAIEKVSDLVEGAVKEGASIALGGATDAFGHNYYKPTILTDVTQNMSIANSEIFGPVAAVFKFKDESEVLKMANDTPYGLAAYFYTRDIGRVFRMMEGLEYGMVGVNEGVISTEVAPFGGIKESGIGREGSRYGIDDYIEIKYCLIGGLKK